MAPKNLSILGAKKPSMSGMRSKALDDLEKEPAQAPAKPRQIIAPRPMPALGTSSKPLKPVAPAPAPAADPVRDRRTRALTDALKTEGPPPGSYAFSGGGPDFGPQSASPAKPKRIGDPIGMPPPVKPPRLGGPIDMPARPAVDLADGALDRVGDGRGGDASDGPAQPITPGVRNGGRALVDNDSAGDADTDELARLRADHAKEQAATKAELAAGKAQDLMRIEARAGRAGFGLSGATAALTSDASRTRDRSDTLALADLGRRQRDEGRADKRESSIGKIADANAEFTKLQRKIALNELETQNGEDVDGDGNIGSQSVADFEQEGRLRDLADKSDEVRGAEPDAPTPQTSKERVDDAIFGGSPIGMLYNAWKTLFGSDAMEVSRPPPGGELRNSDDKYDYYTVGESLYRVPKGAR